jgi:anthranilate synthase/aminodeoxychorismate synthase-like glutamine amidotransferase
MILVLDNYDSFVHTLARYLRELGGDALVRRNDAVSLDEIEHLAPAHIVISPGPRTPLEAGISVDVVRRFGRHTPILGVCLGHQCIAAAYGARIVRAKRPMHGEASEICHDGTGVFAGLPNPFRAARYHSLVVDGGSVPRELHVTATSADGAIMALQHTQYPVFGVQFHPESVLSEHGHTMLRRFMQLEREVTSAA